MDEETKKISLTPKALAAAGLTVVLALPLHKAMVTQPETDVEIPAQPSQLSYTINGTATMTSGIILIPNQQFL